MLKTINELKDGKCKVVASYIGLNENIEKEKEFDGTYNSVLKVVFMTMPYSYNIIGYKQ